jgi:hyperosmotically inducible periplasmic protein
MRIITAIPLIFTSLTACATNRPAEDPSESVKLSEDSSLSSASDSYTEPRGSDVSQPANESVPADSSSDSRANQLASPSTPIAASTAAPQQPDNTAVNERERGGETKTPLDQHNNQPDLNITQAIRKAVMADDSLSFTAKNVKIITQAGHVTLRGPVNTAAERAAIVAYAKQASSVLSVDDQLEVKP